MERPQAILFDIGSTLWSSPTEDPDALARCYGRGRDAILRSGYVAPPMEELIHAVEGHFAEWEDIWRAEPARVEQPPTVDYVARALAGLDLKLDAATLAEFTDALLDTSVFTAMVEPPEPDNGAALTEMRRLGLRLACVSNAFMPGSVLQRILEARGMAGLSEFTVSSCEFGIRKPDARIYQEALRRLDLRPGAVIFVGDRVDADVDGPAAVGMRTVLTHQYRQEDPARGTHRPDQVIPHLRDLASYLATLVSS